MGCGASKPFSGTTAYGHSPSAFSGETPFVLTANVRIKEGTREEYLKHLYAQVDSCKNKELGCHHYTFNADPDDPLAFKWSDVYKNSAAFKEHLGNETLGVYLGKHGELGEVFEIEIIGTISPELKEAVAKVPFPVKIWTTEAGFSRQ